jgi:hypothetical protein
MQSLPIMHHWYCDFESRSGRVVQHYVIKFVSDLRHVSDFLSFPPVSSTNKTDRHDIIEILLKVVRGVARIIEKYRHKMFRGSSWRSNVFMGRSPPEAHGLYNTKSDIFNQFGSAFNNMKFRLFCPFWTIPLRTN